MCRLLGYLGSPIQLDQLLYKPPHALVVQAYQPREMGNALLNADGFGIGWYHAQKPVPPFTYKNILPIWNDINLPHLSRYIEAGCIVAHVRSATPGLAVDLSNCHPFASDGLSVPHQLLFIHNGYIDQFRKTLYQPIRSCFSDRVYLHIQGTTDSEHIFALILDELVTTPTLSLEQALENTLLKLHDLARPQQIRFHANILLSNGKKLIASRYAGYTPAPTLYWLRDDPTYPDAVLVASEPLFDGNWNRVPEQSIICVGEDLEVHIAQLD